jgi:hypothetical protein
MARRSVLLAALAFAALSALPARARAQADTVGGLVVHVRVIGIFDPVTGLPVVGAEVKDILTGLSAVTSPTGTVALPMDTSGAFLRVRKTGYNMNTFLIPNGTADSLPITLTIDRVAQMLPTMITNAKGVARTAVDTSRKLELTGFYDRRLQGQAPATSYISQAQIDAWQPKLLADLVARTGRPWMWGCTIYIDGAKADIPPMSPEPGRYKRNLTTGIDELLDPSMVAGIEVYRSSEVPAQYNATLTGGGAMTNGATDAGCVTLIWTR